MSSAPASAAPAGRVAALLGLLVAITVFGSTPIAVALPEVEREFGLSTTGTAWIIVVFSLAFSVAAAVFGRVADLRGLRGPMRVGVALFAAGSVAAAVAPTYGLLLAGRTLQGLGGGAVPVLAVGVISARYEQDTRARALGTLTAVVTIVSASGPLVAGVVTSLLGWRAVMVMPVLALLILEPVARIAPREGTATGRVDWVGALLVGFATTGAVLLLRIPASGGSTSLVAVATTLLLVGAVGSVVNVLRRPGGFLPRAVMVNRRMMLTSFVAMSLLAAYLGTLLTLPLLFDRAFSWSPLRIGLSVLPAAVVGSLASRIIGGASQRLGRRRVVIGSAAASCAGLLLAAVTAPNPVWTILGFALVLGAFGAGQVALINGVPDIVEPEVVGAALGVFNLVFFTGGAVGTAIVGGVGQAASLAVALAVLALLPAAGAVAARWA